MSEAALVEPPVTTGQFDAFLTTQDDDLLWELVAGRIVAMTNPTEVHEQIASNIGAPLKLAMDPLGCRVYQGGLEDYSDPIASRKSIVRARTSWYAADVSAPAISSLTRLSSSKCSRPRPWMWTAAKSYASTRRCPH